MKYDDASWHSESKFPPESPEEYSGTHIALFLKWCFIQGWAGYMHLQEEPEDTQKVIDGKMPATEYLFRYCDGKLTNEDLNAEGNAFADQYYGVDGLYLDDHAENFGKLEYVAAESSHDFAMFSSMIDSRLKSGVLMKSPTKQKKAWWKFW